MVECENDGSKGGEGKVESHRQGQSCSSAGLVSSEGSIGGAKLRLIGVVGGTGASCTINVCGGSDDLHAAVLSEGREGFRSRQRGPRSGSTLSTSLPSRGLRRRRTRGLSRDGDSSGQEALVVIKARSSGR